MSASILDVAADQQARTQRLATGSASRASQLWARVDARSIMASWSRVAPALFALVASAQRTAALAADPYLVRIAGAQGATTLTDAAVNPAGLSGISSDGRSLQAELLGAPVRALRGIGAGMPVPEAMLGGRVALEMIVATQIADAFRVATQLSMFMRSPDELPASVFKAPHGRLMHRAADGTVTPYFRPKGYVRQVQPRACSRCIILAGARYRNATAFDRHDNCQCTHIPVDENVEDVPPTDPKAYFDAMPRSEQDRVFGKSGAEAIRLGADMNQIVNARSGMFTTQGGLKATRAGTTKRGLFGQSQTEFTRQGTPSKYSRTVAPRLMPEEIIRLSKGDRETAVRLLRQYSFIF